MSTPEQDRYWMHRALELARRGIAVTSPNPAVGCVILDRAGQVSGERGWMLPAYTLPPNAQDVKILRALVKLTLGHSLVEALAGDIAEACGILKDKGGLHPKERKRVRVSQHI